AVSREFVNRVNELGGKWSDAIYMYGRFRLRPCEVCHVFWPETKGAEFQRFQYRSVKTAPHPKPPDSLDDHNVLVHRVYMRHDDVACIVVNADSEDLTGLFWIARHFLDPLPCSHLVQGHNSWKIFVRAGLGITAGDEEHRKRQCKHNSRKHRPSSRSKRRGSYRPHLLNRFNHSQDGGGGQSECALETVQRRLSANKEQSAAKAKRTPQRWVIGVNANWQLAVSGVAKWRFPAVSPAKNDGARTDLAVLAHRLR